MPYNIARGRGGPPSRRGRQNGQGMIVNFISQLVSAFQLIGAGTPPPRRGRGFRGGVRGTRGTSGRGPADTVQTHLPPTEDEYEPSRERSASRGRGRGRSAGAYQDRRAHYDQTEDEQPHRRQRYGRGRRRGRGTYANTGYNADGRPPVSHLAENRTDGTNYFQSDNPDFKDIVKGVNQGARLQHANGNWERLPQSIDKAIDRVTGSIRPPLADQKLSDKISRAAGNFKYAITHAVKEHITEKYAGVCRHLASVDDTDFVEARSIAKKQMLRGSGRINSDTADALIGVVRTDYQARKVESYQWRQVQHSRGRRSSYEQEGQNRPLLVPPVSEPVAGTSNRFSPLNDIDADAVADLMDMSFTDNGQDVPPPIPPKVSRRRDSSSSPEIPPTPGKRLRTFGHFKAPHPVAVEGTPLTSDTPTTLGSVVLPGGTSGRITRSTSVPSVVSAATGGPAVITATGCAPVTIDSDSDLDTESTSVKERAARSTQTNVVPRLSSFAPNNRQNWAIPEIHDDEDTLVITDSNGKSLSQRAPANWRVASYRGGKLMDAVKLLERCPIPTHVTTLIVAIGTNDHPGAASPPMINTVTRLRDLLERQSRRTVLLSIPYFEQQPLGSYEDTYRVNRLLAEVFDGARTYQPVPDTLRLHPLRQNDFVHYDLNSAENLVKFTLSRLQTLN